LSKLFGGNGGNVGFALTGKLSFTSLAASLAGKLFSASTYQFQIKT